jgi:uncharacterized protein involved in outer membrane biogenesis
MHWLKRVLYFLIVLVAIAVALPFVLPLNFYAPNIERFASDRIHEPVTIRGLHIVLLPEPGLVLEDVSAGRLGEFKAQIVRVSVDPFSLMRPVKVLNQISFDSVTMSQEVLGRIPSWSKADAASSQMQIKNIRLNKLKMNVAPVDPGVVSADIALTPEGGFASALVTSEDGKASLAIRPEQDRYTLELNARNWQPPTGPAVVFDEVHVNALLSAEELDMKEIGGSLYGGTIAGAAKLDWHDGWRLNGEMHGKRVEVERVASLLSPETGVSGRMNADGHFSMKAKSYAQLFAVPSVDVKFKVDDGVIHNLDMVKAVRASSGEGSRGGQTRFDELSGALQVAGKSYRLRQLRISSGLLVAEGGVEVGSGNEVSGNFHVQIKGTANLISVPMTLGGTLADPVLKPSASPSVEPVPDAAAAQE